jgi:hypothetical protein
MEFFNGIEELNLVVDSLKRILPLASIGQMVKGSKNFVIVVSGIPVPIQVVVEFEWNNKVLGSYMLKIYSSHDIQAISDEMIAEKAVKDLLSEINFN